MTAIQLIGWSIALALAGFAFGYLAGFGKGREFQSKLSKQASDAKGQ